MKIGSPLLVLLICLNLASCDSKSFPLGDDEYETVVHEGQLYVINRRIGEIARVQGNDLQTIRLTRPTKFSPIKHKQSLRFDDNFGRKHIFRIAGMVKEIGNTVKIRGVATPYILEVDSASEERLFSIRFMEKDGFVIGRVEIFASDMTTTVDETGEPGGFSFQKDVAIPIDQFREATVTSVEWYPMLDATVEEWLKTDEGIEYSAKQTEEPLEENTQPSEPESE